MVQLSGGTSHKSAFLQLIFCGSTSIVDNRAVQSVHICMYVCMYVVCMYICHTLLSVGSLVTYAHRHNIHKVALTRMQVLHE